MEKAFPRVEVGLEQSGQALHVIRQGAEAVSVWQILQRERSSTHVRVAEGEERVCQDFVGLVLENFLVKLCSFASEMHVHTKDAKLHAAYPAVLGIKESIIKYVMELNKAVGLKAAIKREIK